MEPVLEWEEYQPGRWRIDPGTEYVDVRPGARGGWDVQVGYSTLPAVDRMEDTLVEAKKAAEAMLKRKYRALAPLFKKESS